MPPRLQNTAGKTGNMLGSREPAGYPGGFELWPDGGHEQRPHREKTVVSRASGFQELKCGNRGL